jgi:hypothetical protein
MGKASGEQLRVSPRVASKELRHYQEMMVAQARAKPPPWMEPGDILKIWPLVPDVFIAGQVFDGMTGELKRK